MSAPAVAMFDQDQWMADLSAEEARAALQRTLDLAYAIATRKVGEVDNAQAAYLIRVAVFDSARGSAPA